MPHKQGKCKHCKGGCKHQLSSKDAKLAAFMQTKGFPKAAIAVQTFKEWEEVFYIAARETDDIEKAIALFYEFGDPRWAYHAMRALLNANRNLTEEIFNKTRDLHTQEQGMVKTEKVYPIIFRWVRKLTEVTE